MKLSKPREIRLDDTHLIRMRVGKWFPEMILMTVLLASAGTYLYGEKINKVSSIDTTGFLKSNQKKSKQVARKISRKMVAPRSDNVVSTRSVIVNPKIVDTITGSKNIDIKIDSVNIADNTASVTYHIVNLGRQQNSGSTWASRKNDKKPHETPVSWKARYFTIKKATVALREGEQKEVRIHVQDDVANATNSYLIRF